MASIEEYTSLIAAQHKDKPKYMAMVSLTAQVAVDQRNTLDQMLYDIDSATNVMLDYIGEWVGFSRFVAVPLNIYFSFDIVGLGFDQGIWFAPFDPVNGTTRLDDDSYRRLLKARIGINNWDSTIIGFNAIMRKVFEGTTVTAIAIDNQDKTVTVEVSGDVPLVLKALLDSGVMLPKSIGIVNDLVYL